MTDINPRAVMGSNLSPDAPDYAKMEVERLAKDYGELVVNVKALIEEAKEVPRPFPDKDTRDGAASLIKRIRDAKVRVEGFHEIEKQEFLRRGQGVDNFFFRLWDTLMRRDKKNKPGAADILQAELTDYDTKVLEAERARRQREADEQERIAREAAQKAEQERQAAEEARLAAERARKPEIVEAKEAVADQKEVAASESKVEAVIAQGRAEDAHIATLARPADIMRNRGDDGTLSTMATEPYAVVEDDTLLDKEKLWPFISLEAKEKALRGWARNNGHTVQMAGAKIGKKPKSVVR